MYNNLSSASRPVLPYFMTEQNDLNELHLWQNEKALLHEVILHGCHEKPDVQHRKGGLGSVVGKPGLRSCLHTPTPTRFSIKLKNPAKNKKNKTKH